MLLCKYFGHHVLRYWWRLDFVIYIIYIYNTKPRHPTFVSFPMNEVTRFLTKYFILTKSCALTLPEPSNRNAMSAWTGHSVERKRRLTSEQSEQLRCLSCISHQIKKEWKCSGVLMLCAGLVIQVCGYMQIFLTLPLR